MNEKVLRETEDSEKKCQKEHQPVGRVSGGELEEEEAKYHSQQRAPFQRFGI